MTRDKIVWTPIVKKIVSSCEKMFDIKILWDFAEPEEKILEEKCGIFLLPEKAKIYRNINKPLILINLCANIDDISFMCAIAHECRHAYQYAHRSDNIEWDFEFVVGIDKDEYYESALELDAYVFQEEYLKKLVNDENAQLSGLKNFDQEKVLKKRLEIRAFIKEKEYEHLTN